MRGWLPLDVMKSIEVRYRYSGEIEQSFSSIIFPLSGKEERIRDVQIRLENGQHLLNESRYALMEAEAHGLWYEKYRDPPNRVTALFFRRFYLDDASLRLYSSGEYLFKAVRSFWSIPENSKGRYLLERVISGARQTSPTPPFVPALERIDNDQAWKENARHRSDWVHNKLHRIEGLDTAKRITVTPFRSHEAAGFTIGQLPVSLVRIEDLQRNAEDAYSILFSTYESVLTLMEQEIGSHLGADDLSV